MTDPTGSRSGSAAAMPDRTLTPEVVVVPLQYAVAPKSSVVPGRGDGSVVRARRVRAKRESRILVSYSNTKAVTTASVASSFRQMDREISISVGSRLQGWIARVVGSGS